MSPPTSLNVASAKPPGIAGSFKHRRRCDYLNSALILFLVISLSAPPSTNTLTHARTHGGGTVRDHVRPSSGSPLPSRSKETSRRMATDSGAWPRDSIGCPQMIWNSPQEERCRGGVCLQDNLLLCLRYDETDGLFREAGGQLVMSNAQGFLRRVSPPAMNGYAKVRRSLRRATTACSYLILKHFRHGKEDRRIVVPTKQLLLYYTPQESSQEADTTGAS